MEEISIKRNLKRAIPKLEEISSILKLERAAKEEAIRIYNLVLQQDIGRTFSMESVAAACIYTTCRLNIIPRTLSEISFASDIHTVEIGRMYRKIKNRLKLKIGACDLERFALRFAEKLDLSFKVRNKAVSYLRKVKNLDAFRGKNPIGIAASALYLASLICNEKRSQRQFADLAGFTEVTIKHGHRLLIDNLDELKNFSNTNANEIRTKQEKKEMMKPIRKADFQEFIKERIEKEKKKQTKWNLESFQATINHVEDLLCSEDSGEYVKGVRDCAYKLRGEIERSRRGNEEMP